MNKNLTTVLLVLAIVVLAVGIFFAGSLYTRSNMMFGWGNNQYGPGMMYSGGMMDGSGMMNMMGGNGGMMSGSGMMQQYGYSNSNVKPLSVDQAKDAATKYIQSLNVDGLEPGEVMIFDNHAYVIVEEAKTGLGAFELLVDPVTQIAYPEHGPNMMWNLKYGGLNHQSMLGIGNGMMGMMDASGMMNGWSSSTPADISAELTVTPELAREYAQTYLDANISGATAVENPIKFYGYYTFDFEKDGEVAGMLSVNGYSGQIFVHTWHGAFIEETE